MTDDEVHREVLKEAVRELDYARKKYNSLKELEGVIDSAKLEKIKEQIK